MSRTIPDPSQNRLFSFAVIIGINAGLWLIIAASVYALT